MIRILLVIVLISVGLPVLSAPARLLTLLRDTRPAGSPDDGNHYSQGIKPRTKPQAKPQVKPLPKKCPDCALVQKKDVQ